MQDSGNIRAAKSGRQISEVQYSFSRKKVGLVVGGFILAIMAILIWKKVHITRIHNDYKEREKIILRTTNSQMDEVNRRFLKLLAKPYVWAVRAALIEGDTKALNSLGTAVVRESNVVSAMVVDDIGVVVSSTDKKYQGIRFRSFSSSYYLQVDSTVVHKLNDDLLTIASPVMGYDRKLGTLILHYKSNGFKPKLAYRH